MDQELHRQSHTKASFQSQQSDTLSDVHREPMKEKENIILCDDARRAFGSSKIYYALPAVPLPAKQS
jgi:hypothetical protein